LFRTANIAKNAKTLNHFINWFFLRLIFYYFAVWF